MLSQFNPNNSSRVSSVECHILFFIFYLSSLFVTFSQMSLYQGAVFCCLALNDSESKTNTKDSDGVTMCRSYTWVCALTAMPSSLAFCRCSQRAGLVPCRPGFKAGSGDCSLPSLQKLDGSKGKENVILSLIPRKFVFFSTELPPKFAECSSLLHHCRKYKLRLKTP